MSRPVSASPAYRMRSGSQADLPFMETILYEAAYWWRPAVNRPPLKQALAEPHIGRYLREWGRPGDMVVVAEDRDGQPVGAAWCRLLPETEPGYGFIDAAMPELTIGVLTEWRGKGIGRALLMALMRRAREDGFAALSLSVEKGNHAAEALYHRCGFVSVGTVGDSWTMRADLLGPSSEEEFMAEVLGDAPRVAPETSCAANGLTLRKASPSDSEFAYRVKKAAFKEYGEKVWGWDEEEQRQLHERRFAAQDFRVINLAGTDVGILATVVEPEYVKVNQLFLLPEHQGKGIGRGCMLLVMGEARQLGLPVHLRVMKVNPRALAFYRRLGFIVTGETDTHHLMEREA